MTRAAAFEVDDPRGCGLWGAVRSMAIEAGEDAGIDFRLVDVGAPSDLETLGSLAGCDLREREIAVRGGRMWVPRIESIRDAAPHVPPGDDPAYRLCLDNPGQIGGLQMKTYEPPPLGPGMVEIDVKAAALNFRDVMVTLGLLPAAAYERSALGLEVGMEASGVVRRVGAGVDHCRVDEEAIFTQGGCIANRAVVPAPLVFSKPAGLDMEQAASSLSVYLTAYYAKALRLMTSGKHQGKLVLRAPPAGVHPQFPIVDRRPLLDPDATYLVSGGLGGFGLCLLPYLISAGARHLTLMDRDPERRRGADWVRESSALQYDMARECEIDIVAGDVAVAADVERCVAGLRRPLKGVFHLAGVLDDRLLDTMSRESVEMVFAPKAAGALNLHRATSGHPLDLFVMASSTASTFGNPGQINYGAASAYLDGLAAWRRRQGLPALSYNIAAVAEVGMAWRNPHVLRMLRMAGMPPVSIHFAITNLDYALRRLSDGDHLVTALFKQVPLTVDSADYMRIGRLMSNHDAFQGHSDEQLTLETVMTQIAEKVAELCGHDDGDVDEPLASFGFNSISVAELVAFLQNRFNFQVSALDLMTTATCQSLAHAIVHKAEQPEEEAGGESDAVESAGAPLSGRLRGRRRPFLERVQPQPHRASHAARPRSHEAAVANRSRRISVEQARFRAVPAVRERDGTADGDLSPAADRDVQHGIHAGERRRDPSLLRGDTARNGSSRPLHTELRRARGHARRDMRRNLDESRSTVHDLPLLRYSASA